MRRWFVLIAGLALAAAASQSHAQDGIPFNAGPGIAATLNMNQLMMQPVRETVAQTMSRSGGGSPLAAFAAGRPVAALAPGGGRPGAAVASTSYRASPAVNARVREQFAEFIRKTSGDEAARAVSAELARKDYIREWHNHFAGDGLRPGDAADALTGYWVLNWQIANGVEEAQPERVRAVREQVRRIMGSNPAFARLNEAQRQEMAEVMIYNGVVQSNVYASAQQRGDRTLTRKLADAAVARFRNEMGVDLRQLQLTPAGFERGG